MMTFFEKFLLSPKILKSEVLVSNFKSWVLKFFMKSPSRSWLHHYH